jgi:putative Holliday junction resolvase
MGRLLGIDPGTRRIGVALSDPLGRIASPHATIDAHDDPSEDVRAILSLASDNDVDEIVVGHPRNMDGSAGPAADAASLLAERLRENGFSRVTLWDERLSSVEANRAMIAGGARRRARRDAADRVAAAIVLQSYLDARGSRA